MYSVWNWSGVHPSVCPASPLMYPRVPCIVSLCRNLSSDGVTLISNILQLQYDGKMWSKCCNLYHSLYMKWHITKDRHTCIQIGSLRMYIWTFRHVSGLCSLWKMSSIVTSLPLVLGSLSDLADGTACLPSQQVLNIVPWHYGGLGSLPHLPPTQRPNPNSVQWKSLLATYP